ncbi:MAG: hypothetical protein HYW02_01580 [Deltaproteobacteria bacterium]|nr:hypothetical protein [Deltaproteobacteria bacterium]MBI2500170.1 hypothetical protein [Deltaproteobacteria bacterium]
MSTNPSILEIGPGRGDFLISLAQNNPLKQIAAIEYKRKRFEKLLRRLEPYPNVSVLFGDARIVVPEKFQEEVFDEVYILYSDPWPKRRHAKHRLFQTPFLKDLHRSLKAGGSVFVATDDSQYKNQIQEVFAELPEFLLKTADASLFPTFYAEKWSREGRSLQAMAYKKA